MPSLDASLWTPELQDDGIGLHCKATAIYRGMGDAHYYNDGAGVYDDDG